MIDTHIDSMTSTADAGGNKVKFVIFCILALPNTLRWAHTVHDATHDGKNLTCVSALKTLSKTIPFPQYFRIKYVSGKCPQGKKEP